MDQINTALLIKYLDDIQVKGDWRARTPQSNGADWIFIIDKYHQGMMDETRKRPSPAEVASFGDYWLVA